MSLETADRKRHVTVYFRKAGKLDVEFTAVAWEKVKETPRKKVKGATQ